MKLIKALLSFAVAIALSLPLAAHAAKENKKKTDKNPATQFAALDKNGDGVITEEEYVAAMKDKLGDDGSKNHFAELDKNHDGKLTKGEFGVPSDDKKVRKKKKDAV